METTASRLSRGGLAAERLGPTLGARLRRVLAAGRADLHVHSSCSDGALTDHDDIQGARRARDFARRRGAARGHRSVGALAGDLPLDAIEVINNAGVFSWLYDAWQCADALGPGPTASFPVTSASRLAA